LSERKRRVENDREYWREKKSRKKQRARERGREIDGDKRGK
jgi:hypothetical protein